jgi:hypothetical protein
MDFFTGQRGVFLYPAFVSKISRLNPGVNINFQYGVLSTRVTVVGYLLIMIIRERLDSMSIFACSKLQIGRKKPLE